MKKTIYIGIGGIFCLLLVACGGTSTPLTPTNVETDGSVNFKMEAWADNWFAAYIGEDFADRGLSFNHNRTLV